MPRDTGIADRLRAAGLKVVEVAGWQTRGSENFAPRGSVDHHTAGPSTAYGTAPSLGICINGRTGLPGPLCNVLIGRDNTCYVVAAGRANHAGLGGWRGLTGNSSVFGVERENVGNATEPWRLDQYDVAAKVHAALIKAHGANADLVCEHKEWAPRRKIDAYGVDGDQMRGLVKDRLAVPPKPTPSDQAAAFYNAIKREAARRPVLREGDLGTWVLDLQRNLNAIVGKTVVKEDSHFGAETRRWVTQFQKDRNLKADGVVGEATWQNILAARIASGR